MKDPQSLAKYIALIATKLRLHQWDIMLSDQHCNKHSAAAITTVYGRQIAEVSVNKKWDSYPPEEQRHAITHELLHLHMSETTNLVFDDLGGILKPEAFEMYCSLYRRQMEKTVDRLADLIAPNLPLPVLSTTEIDQAVSAGNLG